MQKVSNFSTGMWPGTIYPSSERREKRVAKKLTSTERLTQDHKAGTATRPPGLTLFGTTIAAAFAATKKKKEAEKAG